MVKLPIKNKTFGRGAISMSKWRRKIKWLLLREVDLLFVVGFFVCLFVVVVVVVVDDDDDDVFCLFVCLPFFFRSS